MALAHQWTGSTSREAPLGTRLRQSVAFQRIIASRANARIHCWVSRLLVGKMPVCRVARG